MSAPHLAATLALTQRALQVQSKGEGAQLRKALQAELNRTMAALATPINGDAYVGLMRKKGRLQDALGAMQK